MRNFCKPPKNGSRILSKKVSREDEDQRGGDRGVMGDVKDILGLSGFSAPAPRAAKQTIKKPEGMSREVFQLLLQDAQATGTSALPLMPTQSPTEAFKQKRTRIIGWDWRSFTNSAREDSLVLHHWAKNSDKSTDYTFSRFNKKIKALTYTDEEYDRHLTHPAWDKSESALLFELCRRFDLRWTVVHDRFPEGRTCAHPRQSLTQVPPHA